MRLQWHQVWILMAIMFCDGFFLWPPRPTLSHAHLSILHIITYTTINHVCCWLWKFRITVNWIALSSVRPSGGASNQKLVGSLRCMGADDEFALLIKRELMCGNTNLPAPYIVLLGLRCKLPKVRFTEKWPCRNYTCNSHEYDTNDERSFRHGYKISSFLFPCVASHTAAEHAKMLQK